MTAQGPLDPLQSPPSSGSHSTGVSLLTRLPQHLWFFRARCLSTVVLSASLSPTPACKLQGGDFVSFSFVFSAPDLGSSGGSCVRVRSAHVPTL